MDNPLCWHFNSLHNDEKNEDTVFNYLASISLYLPEIRVIKTTRLGGSLGLE